MKKKREGSKRTVEIFGVKMSTDSFASLIICFVLLVFVSIYSFCRNDKLTKGKTMNINAEIIDIHIKTPGGVGLKVSYPELRCKYYFEGKEYLHWIRFSKEQWTNVHIGDCIELIVSLDNENIYKWNKEKGTFKCY